jgi:hypothetical protein
MFVYTYIWWQIPHLYDLWNMNKWMNECLIKHRDNLTFTFNIKHWRHKTETLWSNLLNDDSVTNQMYRVHAFWVVKRQGMLELRLSDPRKWWCYALCKRSESVALLLSVMCQEAWILNIKAAETLNLILKMCVVVCWVMTLWSLVLALCEMSLTLLDLQTGSCKVGSSWCISSLTSF